MESSMTPMFVFSKNCEILPLLCVKISGLRRFGFGSMDLGTSRWFVVIGVCGDDPASFRHCLESPTAPLSRYVAETNHFIIYK